MSKLSVILQSLEDQVCSNLRKQQGKNKPTFSQLRIKALGRSARVTLKLNSLNGFWAGSLET